MAVSCRACWTTWVLPSYSCPCRTRRMSLWFPWTWMPAKTIVTRNQIYMAWLRIPRLACFTGTRTTCTGGLAWTSFSPLSSVVSAGVVSIISIINGTRLSASKNLHVVPWRFFHVSVGRMARILLRYLYLLLCAHFYWKRHNSFLWSVGNMY